MLATDVKVKTIWPTPQMNGQEGRNG